MEGEGGAFVSLDEVVTRIFDKPSITKNNKMNKRPNLLEGRTKEWDYYNRPSLHTSANIAVISFIGLIILIIGIGVLEIVKKVSKDRNDFDNTYNKINKDIPIETLYDGKEWYDGTYNELTSIFTSKRVSRAMNEQVTSYQKTSNV